MPGTDAAAHDEAGTSQRGTGMFQSVGRPHCRCLKLVRTRGSTPAARTAGLESFSV